MPTPLLLALSLASAACLLGCAAAPERAGARGPADPDREAARVLDALNGETRAARARDYAGWREHWVHAPYVVKTYTNEVDGTSSVMLGWDAVDDFVRTYLEDHPEPDPAPDPLTDADVRLFGDAAWVVYEQVDPAEGAKREARRLERVDGAWRIAGMHTTVLDAAGRE